MDKSNVAVGESSPASATKSTVSHVPVGSIAIDISCPVEETEQAQHDHFSIRGFVAGVRKKNMKMCSLFPSELGNDILANDLPMLLVPKFRWWQCSECVPGLSSSETVRINRNHNASTSSYHNAGNKKQADDSMAEEKQHDNNAVDTACRSTGVDGPENGSSGSEGGFAAIPPRRKLKLRYLADILEEGKNSASGNLRAGSASSNGTRTTSLTLEDDFKLHVLSEGRKRARTVRRKKRAASIDGEGTGDPTDAAKRLKRHVSEKSSKRLQVSESEAETVASTRLDLQYSSRKKQLLTKKSNIVHTTKRKRLVKNDPRSVVMRTATNLGKHLAAYESGSGSMVPGTSICGEETAPLLNGNHELSDSKTANAASFDSSGVSPNTSISGHCNTQDKVTLDLSLDSHGNVERNTSNENEQPFVDHRGIPDLNEAIVDSPSAIQESQLPPFSEKSFPEKKWGMSTFASEADVVGGQDVSQLRSVKSKDDDVELQGTSDDIPMEIVELLAKNQQERISANSKQHLLPDAMPSSSGRYAEACNGMINLPNSSSTVIADQNTAFSGGIISFPQGKYFQFEASKQRANHFRLFTPHAASQQRNIITEPPGEKNSPFSVAVGQKCITQPNGFFQRSFPDQSCKGRGIRDMNGVEKANRNDASTFKDGRTPSTPVSSVAIPAMQLLSLTNQRTASSLPFQVGYSSLPDKPSSQNLCEKQNHLLLGSPVFSPGIHPRNFQPLLSGASFSGGGFSRPYLHAQMLVQQRCSGNDHSADRSIHDLPTKDPSLQLCVLNQNPADFTIIDARNEYTITARDLKSKNKQRLPPVTEELPKKKWVRRNLSRDQDAALDDAQTYRNVLKQHKSKNAR